MRDWYKNLEDRFSSFPSDVQIMNIMSDLNKAKNLKVTSSSTNHLYRALILIDYLKKDLKWSPKLKELLRLREAICSLIAPVEPYATIEQIIKTCMLLDKNVYRRLSVNTRE